MQPSLDEVQQAVNKATHMVLAVSRGIARWGQQRYSQPHPDTVNKDLGKNDKPKVQLFMKTTVAEDAEGMCQLLELLKLFAAFRTFHIK